MVSPRTADNKTQISTLCNFLHSPIGPISLEYPPHNPTLKTPSAWILTWYERPSFTSRRNNRRSQEHWLRFACFSLKISYEFPPIRTLNRILVAPKLRATIRNALGSCIPSVRPPFAPSFCNSSAPNTSRTQITRTHCSFPNLRLTVELHDSYCSLINTVWVIKQGGMIRAGPVARNGKHRNADTILKQTLKEREYVEDLRVVGRTILK